MKTKLPSEQEVAATLGPAQAAWDGIIAAIGQNHGPIDREWKPSKLSFGRVCLLKQKKRTLLYLIPEEGSITAAVVVGERAVALALASTLPATIKTLITEARPYAEGRGIRFPVSLMTDVAIVEQLVAMKIASTARAKASVKTTVHTSVKPSAKPTRSRPQK